MVLIGISAFKYVPAMVSSMVLIHMFIPKKPSLGLSNL